MKMENLVNFLLVDLNKPLSSHQCIGTGVHLKCIWMYFCYNSLRRQNLNHMLMNRNKDHREVTAHKWKFVAIFTSRHLFVKQVIGLQICPNCFIHFARKGGSRGNNATLHGDNRFWFLFWVSCLCLVGRPDLLLIRVRIT